MKEFEGVILYHHPSFNYKGECRSVDGFISNEGEQCIHCSFGNFGSKECIHERVFYVLRENDIFPLIYVANAYFIDREFVKYVKSLLSKGKRTIQVITTFKNGKFSSDLKLHGKDYSELSDGIRKGVIC